MVKSNIDFENANDFIFYNFKPPLDEVSEYLCRTHPKSKETIKRLSERLALLKEKHDPKEVIGSTSKLLLMSKLAPEIKESYGNFLLKSCMDILPEINNYQYRHGNKKEFFNPEIFFEMYKNVSNYLSKDIKEKTLATIACWLLGLSGIEGAEGFPIKRVDNYSSFNYKSDFKITRLNEHKVNNIYRELEKVSPEKAESLKFLKKCIENLESKLEKKNNWVNKDTNGVDSYFGGRVVITKRVLKPKILQEREKILKSAYEFLSPYPLPELSYWTEK